MPNTTQFYYKIIRVNFLLTLMIFSNIYSYSQINLVPNSSFENFNVSCSSLQPGIGAATYWVDPQVSPLFSYTYSNVCSVSNCCGVPYNTYGNSYQNAHSGSAYVGGYFYRAKDIRDYLQTKLLDTLQRGKCYYIEYYINLNDADLIATNNVALLISDTTIQGYKNQFIAAKPQILQYGNPIISDTMNWVKVGGVYTAHGGEQFITIGNFNDNNHTDTIHINATINIPASGYNIDDVSVIPLYSMQLKAEAGRDTTIIKGDSVWIGSRLCGLTNVVWYDAANNVLDTGAPGLWVKPTSNTFYVIEQNVCGQYSRDTVFVNVQPLPVSMLNFECLMLNERQVKVSWQTATEINVSHFNVQRSIDGVTFETIGKVNVKGASTYNFNDPLTTHDSRFTTLYYRLEIVDKNGALSYSDIKELSIINSSLSITPNPAKDYITINGGNIKEVRISDVSGRVLLVGNTKKVDVRGLVSGVYYVAIETLNGNHAIYKFVKL